MRKKRFAAFALAAVLLALAFMPVRTFAAETAQPMNSAVLVDGKQWTFDAYDINGYNYFMLRHLAFVLSGTAKQFAVGWDGASNAITLMPGVSYVSTGDEMTGKGSGTKSATRSDAAMLLSGVNMNGVEAYNIDGYNYYKLRDIGIMLDVGIGWDGAGNTITIDSGMGYVESQNQSPDPLEESISAAIMTHNQGKFGGGDFACQAHITLGSAQSGSAVTAYVMALYEEYRQTDSGIADAGGLCMPAVITFNKDGAGNYQLTGYVEPENGGDYDGAILDDFPKDLWDKLDTQFYIAALQAYTMAQAQEHYQ